MSIVNTFFVLNDDKELEINRLELKKIVEYNTLIVRDKGSAGDYDGRKKLRAGAELYYIYLVYDIRSVYVNLPLEHRKLKARQDAKLPDTWDENDEAVQAAIRRYLEDFKLTSAGKAYMVAEKAYHTMASDVEDIQETLINNKLLLKNIVAKLGGHVKTQAGEMEIMTKVTECNAIIAEMLKLQKDMNTNIQSFGKLSLTVKELAAKFREEGGDLKIVVGGRELGNREE